MATRHKQSIELTKGKGLYLKKLLNKDLAEAEFRLEKEKQNTGWLAMDDVTNGYLANDIKLARELLIDISINPFTYLVENGLVKK